MFKTHKSVSTICQNFTSQLELTQAAEEARAQKLTLEISERTTELALVQIEANSAGVAITNIRKLFGAS
jgi:hypothetical protein